MSLTFIVIGLIFFIWVIYSEKSNKELERKIKEDEEIDYKNELELFKVDKNGIDYLVATCMVYQQNKERVIRSFFVPGNIINWNDVQWEVISTPEYEHEEKDGNTKYERIVNKYLVKVRYISKLNGKQEIINNYGIISEINDSKFYSSNLHIDNQVEVNKELIKKIDELLQMDSKNNEILDLKKELRLLKYEILNNEVNNEEIPNLIEKMKKLSETAAPFASLLCAIIDLAQKVIK
ncbi:hypothetical protein [Listeria ivanovii]|uniref:Uncharacterized protein n=2 Tax=Listeria ivanovii TaxID=1638 RepID=A0ABS1G8L0_LISIV|nr:hypothetical protein [Listeria ivanovii]EFR98170.1 hypothetical protein NT05LI_0474 [Listeria ivanovii FSL F6-596]AIS58826.1 hypothetical protein JL58_02010 [Listeria ivanovii subsp. londoniensis]MBK1963222.1 hypothetical protein [Listeria ivanovii subsp. londoniensis]MBM5607731.1 hypothetical protein [Listeria ivanovii]MBM5636254.1 hypothetical protein [Listeria ivanovii]